MQTSHEEERKIILSAQAGNQQAVRHLIDSHKAFIKKMARRYGKNMEFEDACSEGITGMLQALPKFNPETGYRFHTYARFYIAEAIRKASLRAPLIRLIKEPNGSQELREARKLAGGSESLDEIELAKKLNVSKDRARYIAGRLYHQSPKNYAPISDAFQVADTSFDVEEYQDLKSRRDILIKAKSVLDPRETKIFDLRIAADDEPWTLKDLGDVFGIGIERVRQIEARAIKKFMAQVEKMKSEHASLT